MKRYANKVVLVTASATGIGLAISRRMAEEGATVIISSRSQANVDKAVSELQQAGLSAVGFVCHVANKEHRGRLLEFIKAKYGRLDVLVLNAAVSVHFGSLFDTTEAHFDKTFEVNLKSIFFMVKEYRELLPKGGSILIISSYVAYSPDPMIGIYSLSKTATNGLVKILAKEFHSEEIRVNAIAPGLIKTKFAGSLLDHEEQLKTSMGINRVGLPEDIGNAAAYLCSADASYVTGEILMVGGFVSQRL